MSLARPNDAPSPAPEEGDGADSEFSRAALVRLRGASLLDALEAQVPSSREHAEATASYAFCAAVELGHERSRCELVRETAALHDVGKLYGADGDHEAGRDLARGAGVPDEVCDWLLHARERFDGQGPQRLAGEEIPLESRIVRAACACDSLLASPSSGASADERRRRSVEQLRRMAGAELDPRVCAALVLAIDRAGAAGSTAAA
jgi:HD-GYP domain-containing protein (c-di-GMP phosphodiesterase class II)